MSTVLFILIGFITSETLKSCDVTFDMWQHWVILACIIASMAIAYFLM